MESPFLGLNDLNFWFSDINSNIKPAYMGGSKFSLELPADAKRGTVELSVDDAWVDA